MEEKREPLSEMAIERKIQILRNKHMDSEVIALVKSDYEYGLTDDEIGLYLNKSYDIEQMKVLSKCLHKGVYKRQRSSCVELQKEIDKLQQMKSKAETQKFQLYDDYTKGIVQRDIMISERTMLTEHIGEIEIELHELESKIQLEQCINKAGEEETIELLSKMETFDLDLIRQVVKRITMYDDGNIQFEWNVDDFIQVK